MNVFYRKHLVVVLLYVFTLSSSLTVYARVYQPKDLVDKPFNEAAAVIPAFTLELQATEVLPVPEEDETAEQPEPVEEPVESDASREPQANRDYSLAGREQAQARMPALPAQAQVPPPGTPASATPAPPAAAPNRPAEPDEEAKPVTHPPAQSVPAPPAQPVDGVPSLSLYDTDLNDYVQDVIATFTFRSPYLLNNDYANYNGVTENLFYGDRLLAKAHPSGTRYSHCSGITFEVFFKAMQARNRKLGLSPDDFNGMSFDNLFDFLLTWYVANGPKRTSNIEVAVEKYGIGTKISRLNDAKRGDFMDISRRNGTGHTVVFQNWVRDSQGKITGVRYWSSQGSTNGVGYHTETFDHSGGNVLSNQVYIARVLPVHQYKSFR